jgi:hypothetical protein
MERGMLICVLVGNGLEVERCVYEESMDRFRWK